LRGGGVWLVIPILTILIVVMIVKPASEMEKKFKEKVDSGSTQDIFLQQLISR
jgi:hypothetical protein